MNRCLAVTYLLDESIHNGGASAAVQKVTDGDLGPRVYAVIKAHVDNPPQGTSVVTALSSMVLSACSRKFIRSGDIRPRLCIRGALSVSNIEPMSRLGGEDKGALLRTHAMIEPQRKEEE